MSLTEQAEHLAYEVAFDLVGLRSPDYPVDKLGRLSMELSGKLRTLAIISLLAKAHTDLFCHHLIRSGLVRETYLRRLAEQGITSDLHYGSGRYAALLDAVAVPDFELAERIVQLSPFNWQENHEYEDDFCYAQILHRFVSGVSVDSEVPLLLKRFETCLAGEPSARFDTCAALLANDQDQFDKAFGDLLKTHEAEMRAAEERDQIESMALMTQSSVFVEGLGVLRLAERRGLKTQGEYSYCPHMARAGMQVPFPGE